MLNSKYISVKAIIERLYSDNGYQYDLPFADLLEFVADALNLISHPDQYLKKVIGYKDYEPFDIKKYRAELPCDFHQLVQIAVDGFPATPSNHSFHHLMSGDCCNIDDLGTSAGDTFVDNFGNVFNTALGTKYTQDPVTYTLNNNWLTLSNKKGKVCMSYLAFPTDDEGYPLIPDDVTYKEYIKWYLTYKLDWIEFRKGSLSREVLDRSEQKYLWYVGAASNAAKMPDMNKMENLKAQMLRILPKTDNYSGFFKALSYPEQRKMN